MAFDSQFSQVSAEILRDSWIHHGLLWLGNFPSKGFCVEAAIYPFGYNVYFNIADIELSHDQTYSYDTRECPLTSSRIF